MFLPHDAIYHWSLGLNILFGVAVISLFFRYLRWKFGYRDAIIGTISLGACPAIAYWTWSGMETVMYLFFQIILWYGIDRYAKEDDRLSLLAILLSSGLLVLTRVDGFIFPLVGAVYLLFVDRKLMAFRTIVVTLVVWMGLSLWQYAYYGDLFPNTTYVKVGPGGLGYKIQSALFIYVSHLSTEGILMPTALLIIGLIFPFLLSFGKRVNIYTTIAKIPFGIVAGISAISYFFLIGGDYMGVNRFCLIVWPAAIVVLLSLPLINHQIKSVTVVTLVSSALLLQLPSYWDYRDNVGKFFTIEYSKELGGILKNNLPPNSKVAVLEAGVAPFFAPDLIFIDQLGLNDRHIAKNGKRDSRMPPGHQCHDWDYVISLDPDVIFAHVSNDDVGLGLFGELLQKWTTVERLSEKGYEQTSYGFVKRDLLPENWTS